MTTHDEFPDQACSGPRLSRRTALRAAGATGLGLAGAAAAAGHSTASQAPTGSGEKQPNILVILVDEMRDWQWFPDQAVLNEAFPAMARLQDGAVRFGRHYCSAAMCTPSRGSLVTGLYAHQTGLTLTIGGNVSTFIAGEQNPAILHGGANATPAATPAAPEATPVVSAPPYPVLDPRFPTWGTLLRQQGYDTYWYGKWHVNDESCDMEQYGFGGGTCPSPNGAPGEGQVEDPNIADQAIAWLQNQNHATPWCTTVSFINPHDIQFYPRQTRNLDGQSDPPSVIDNMPENYETAADLARERKPHLQLASIVALIQVFGEIPHRGPNFERGWLKMLDLYFQLHKYVDTEIGRVLDALEAQPEVAENTIIVFTSDHGDYVGSHGLRGKGAGLYDEGIRVPLWVKDPTGKYAANPETPRNQITSAVDLVPMLLTLATGDTNWKNDPDLAYLANRHDLVSIMQDPDAPGRDHALHTTDEDGFEYGPLMFPFLENAPFHVLGAITEDAKLGVYTHWAADSDEILPDDQEFEFYDYTTDEGRLELANTAGDDNPKFTALYDKLMNDLLPNEIRAPLPEPLETARNEAMAGTLARIAFDRAVG